MELVIISAIAHNRVIGNKGDLPWPKLKEDFKHFRDLTTNHPVIMGRTTYESIIKRLGKPLPNRTNIVLTRDKSLKNFPNIIAQAGQVVLCYSLDEALSEAAKRDKIGYIIGGQKVYEGAIGLADRLELTEINANFQGDSFFPRFDLSRWYVNNRITKQEEGINYSFASYVRK